MKHRPGLRQFSLRWPGRAALAGLLAAVPAVFAGCPGHSGGGTPKPTAADADWAWLDKAKKSLDAERAQLSQVTPADSAARQKRERDLAAHAAELDRRLVDFINSRPPVEGEKLAGHLLAAVRMKSDEDILLAHQYIEQGGDYRRAIEIYETALAVDPDNPRLRQELEDALARRYMTGGRFAQVKKGMTEDQVRALLGQPNARDVRDFPARGVAAWFYPKNADGQAAAVWFAKEKGIPTVYMADFNAVGAAPGS